MDFSDKWRSLWSAANVFRSPCLLRSSLLGPLNFIPSPEESEPVILLPFQSLAPHPSLFSQSPVLRSSFSSFLCSYLVSSIASDILHDDDTPLQNGLHALQRHDGNFVLFFATGDNCHLIGYVIIATEAHSLIVRDYDFGDKIFEVHYGLCHRILQISVSPSQDISSPSCTSLTDGFLLLRTLYSVHWYRIETRIDGRCPQKPELVHLAFAEFRHRVSHACWSHHLQHESMVLLETGELRLFDMDFSSRILHLPLKLHGSLLWTCQDHLTSSGTEKRRTAWFSCEFTWHPRILVVAASHVVLLLDLRSKQSKVTVLAKIELCDSVRVHSMEDNFTALCRAGYDDFCLSVASQYHLLLLDTRQPLTPILQWVHGLHAPSYINMFKLADLRPCLEGSQFSRASDSGYSILLGSFWHGEFSIFCYGPSLPVLSSSVALEAVEFYNSFYAWGLPSSLSIHGKKCRCGSCLLEEDVEVLGQPAGSHCGHMNEMVIGFCIFSDKKFDFTDLGGFTLVRLMSTGKLESQRYQASWNPHTITCGRKGSILLNSSDSLAYSHVQDDALATRCRYLKWDYLFSYLDGKAAKIMTSKMHSKKYHAENTYFFPSLFVCCASDTAQYMPLKLSISNILQDVGFPCSIYEVAYVKMGMDLPSSLVRLAFTKRSNLVQDHKTSVHKEFLLAVPTLSRHCLHFLISRVPSQRSEKWSAKVLQDDDVFLGPLSPLHLVYGVKAYDRS